MSDLSNCLQKCYAHEHNEAFTKELYDLIITHLDNSSFKVSDIHTEMGVSRAQLYRKLKASLGLSAKQLIDGVRIQKSLELLSISEFPVSEIAAQVGLDPENYTRSFRKKWVVARWNTEKEPVKIEQFCLELLAKSRYIYNINQFQAEGSPVLPLKTGRRSLKSLKRVGIHYFFFQ
ncbi:MAG: helix-turn-helix domain-containing protein [Bacteroidia bacterium]|nr:helix-turn-helix domain-containing protein [Bacteroidia bacterium]